MDQRIIDKYNLVPTGHHNGDSFIKGIITYAMPLTGIYMKDDTSGLQERVEVMRIYKVGNVKTVDVCIWTAEALIELDFEAVINEIKNGQ